ncbi:hypothetical protein ACLOJK_004945, partial [Asimina triloba]
MVRKGEGSIEKKLIYDEKGKRKLEDVPQLAPPRLDLVEPLKFGSTKMAEKLPKNATSADKDDDGKQATVGDGIDISGDGIDSPTVALR